jgi:hypothetical protein
VHGTRDALRSYSGTDSLRVLAWWPALSVIWWAAMPGAGVADVLGIGLGLTILGLVDAAASAWGRRHEAVGGRAVLKEQATTGSPTHPAIPTQPQCTGETHRLGVWPAGPASRG